MNVPNFQQAFIDEPKLRDYLLSPTHPQGASKARFLESLGYGQSDIAALQEALLYIIANFDVSSFQETAHGVKYVVDGLLPVPNGYDALVRTIWIIEKGKTAPRFITMHPL
jgi:hypothetical protein